MWCDRGGSRNRRKRRYMMNEMKIAGERIAAINPKLMLKTIFALNTEIRRIMTTPPRPNRAPRPRLRSGEGQKELEDVGLIGRARDSNCRRQRPRHFNLHSSSGRSRNRNPIQQRSQGWSLSKRSTLVSRAPKRSHASL